LQLSINQPGDKPGAVDTSIINYTDELVERHWGALARMSENLAADPTGSIIPP
jgi:hypothetical protein